MGSRSGEIEIVDQNHPGAGSSRRVGPGRGSWELQLGAGTKLPRSLPRRAHVKP